MYGSEVTPNPPRQDMNEIDVIAGSVHDRSASLTEFTGAVGMTHGVPGLGGQAEPPEASKAGVDHPASSGIAAP